SSPHTGRLDILKEQIKDKKVAVIGGGSVAMDCAGFAASLGAKDVYLVYRRSFSQMPAENDEKIESLEKNIHFLILNQPKAYLTNDKGVVSGIKLVRTELSQAKGSGRRSPVEVKDSQWVLDIDLVVEAIGNKAFETSSNLYPGVDIDDKKLIKVKFDDCQTSKQAIFAGGDIVRGPSLVVNAVQDGKTAANAIDSYLVRRRAKLTTKEG
ncbi:MAG: FAD-dependent oxidoreductase, partial [Proteobacteria bacterium]|nr:FAD-dependent oxidoreductase [Pseudomonadota bacterium]